MPHSSAAQSDRRTPLTLVILAAGIGRRYGGLKQLEPVGPSGETIMDYSIHDAQRAGFGRVVFVIRPDMEAAVRAGFGRRYEQHLAVAHAHQQLEVLPAGFTLPAGRTKPWGTGHAVLAAADLIDGPFAVANADDFYGANSYAALGAFLRDTTAGPVPTYAMVGYRLCNTLSEAGAVARGVCHCGPDGWLEHIVETIGIRKVAAGGHCVDQAGQTHTLPGDLLVSMNLWGFAPAIFDELRTDFRCFLQQNAGSLEAEFFLPFVIQAAIAAGRARVKVLPTPDAWCGITHPQDRPRVTQIIRGLVARGVYPEKLWA